VATVDEPAEPPGWALGLTVGGSYRATPEARDVPPALGLAFSTFVGRRYATVARRLELGVAASFSYQRFARTVQITHLNAEGVEIARDGVRALSMGDFVALQTFTGVFGRLRPWLSVGGGLSLGNFNTEETKYRPGESRPVMALVQTALGFHLEVAPQTDGGLQLDFVHPFSRTFLADSGQRYHVFGDRVAVRLEMQYRF
jgi:hypothetical protein